MKKRILFVDDEPLVLSGLQRMLRGFRHEWTMAFAESSQAALEQLALACAEKEPFDIVVSDMRMPGMDGAQLLDEVMQRYPETVRIVLSGQSEQEAILRVIGSAHQFLSKPCDPETMKKTITRACALRDKLAQPSLKKLVSQVTTLPSLPGVYMQLVEELQSPEASVQRVSELIAHDVGMTAKLLQLVNSSFFGLPRHVESPAHAASLLGLNLLKPLVLSASIFSQYENSCLKGYSLDEAIVHSLMVSSLAKQITSSQTEDQQMVEDTMLAGLLHDVGQLVLATNLPKEYGDAMELAEKEAIPLFEAEMELLGASHADIGAYLLGLWGLPDPIVEAVAFHHEPSKCPHEEFSPLTAVHVANVLGYETLLSEEIGRAPEIDLDYLERLEIASKLPQWRNMIQAIPA